MLKSIRWTLQLWHAGLLAAVLAVFGAAIFFEIRRARFAQIDAELERTVQLLVAGVRPPRPFFVGPDGPRFGPDFGGRGPGPGGPGPGFDGGFGGGSNGGPPPDDGERPRPELSLPAALAGRFDGADAYFVVWDRDGEVLARSARAPDLAAPPPVEWPPPSTGPAVGPGPRRFGPPDPRPPVISQSGDARQAAVSGPFGIRVVTGRSVVPEQRELRRLAGLMAATGVAVSLVGLAGGLALAGRAVRPIRAITAAAKSVTAANLSQRIDAADTESELGELAGVLNATFARLESAFAQQVRFTADASHELRTPLAVIHAQTQLALSRDRPAAEYRKTIETCQRASTRMKELVDSLLLLAGVDAGRLTLQRSRFDLAGVVRDCADLLAPLAAGRGVAVELSLSPAMVDADRMRVGQVVTNVLGNAVRYNRDGGRVAVTLTGDAGRAVLAIADTGIGIAPEHRAHLFERFYRVDPARSRAEGGSGLGLAIARGIVDAHGGTIDVTGSADDVAGGGGTVFTIRLPLAPT